MLDRHSADRLRCGVLNGKVKPGTVIAIVDRTHRPGVFADAQFYAPAQIIMIDLDDNPGRRDALGATSTVNGRDARRPRRLLAMTGGAASIADRGRGCARVLRTDARDRGSRRHDANMAVHGTKVDLHLERIVVSENIRSPRGSSIP